MAPTRLSAAPEAVTERHLDAVLAPRGFHVLHDCAWPGSRMANIDHVVIGASGVWVVGDARGMGRLRSSTKTAEAQARAVSGILGGAATHAILSIHDAEVPGDVIDDGPVIIAAAIAPTIDVILEARTRLKPSEVDRLAAIACSDLQPRAVASPASVTL